MRKTPIPISIITKVAHWNLKLFLRPNPPAKIVTTRTNRLPMRRLCWEERAVVEVLQVADDDHPLVVLAHRPDPLQHFRPAFGVQAAEALVDDHGRHCAAEPCVLSDPGRQRDCAAEALAARGFAIERRKLQLPEPIKKIGAVDVPVKLHRDVTATVKVKVVAEGAGKT